MNLTSARKDGEEGNRRKQKEKVGRRNRCIGEKGDWTESQREGNDCSCSD